MSKEIKQALIGLVILLISAYFSSSYMFAKIIFHAINAVNTVLSIFAFFGLIIDYRVVKENSLFIFNISVLIIASICGYFGYILYSIYWIAYVLLFNTTYNILKEAE